MREEAFAGIRALCTQDRWNGVNSTRQLESRCGEHRTAILTDVKHG